MSVKLGNISTGQNNGGSSLTISHIVANNDNRMLIVAVHLSDSVVGSRTVTGITYNSVAMTLIGRANQGVGNTNSQELWRLIAPSVGTFNVVITVSGATVDLGASVIDLYNVMQQAPEASNTAVNGGTPVSASVTTLSGLSLIISSVDANGTTAISHGTGQVERTNFAMSASRGSLDTEEITSGSSQTQSESATGSNRMALVVGVITGIHEISVNDAITTTENISVVVSPVISVYDSITIVENLNIARSILYLDVLDPFHVVITESTDVLDLTVEVGIVMDSITLNAQFVDLSVNPLFASYSESISVSDYQSVIVNELNIFTEESISISEERNVSLESLNIDASDVISISEIEETYLTNLNIEVSDSVSIIEKMAVYPKGKMLPASIQNCSWNDGTRYWRAYYEDDLGAIVFEYTLDIKGSWTENVNARITSSGVSNDFAVYGGSFTVGIVYRDGNEIKGMNYSGSYPSTSWGWNVSNVILTNGSKKYSYPTFSISGDGYFFCSAMETNGSNQYVVVTQSVNPYDYSSWNTPVAISDTGRTDVNRGQVSKTGTGNKILCLYEEGNSLKIKVWSGSSWGSEQTITASHYKDDTTHFDSFLVLDENHIGYTISPSRNAYECDYEGDVDILSASELLSDSSCKNVSVGRYYGDVYITYAWVENPTDMFDPNSKAHVIYCLETLSTGFISPALTIAESSEKYISRMHVCKTSVISSGFVSFEQPDAIMRAELLVVSVSKNEAISVSEFIEIHLTAYNFEYNDVVSVLENISLSLDSVNIYADDYVPISDVLDLYIEELNIVSDENISVSETTNLMFDVFNIDIFDGILITEIISFIDLQCEIGVVSDSILITDISEMVIDELNVLVSDDISVSEEIYIAHVYTIFVEDDISTSEELFIEKPIEVNVYEIITIEDEAFGSIDNLFMEVYDDILVSESVEVLDIVIELWVDEDVGVNEEVDFSFHILYIDVDQSISVSDEVSLCWGIIYINVIDPFGVLITEHAEIIDGFREVGVVDTKVKINEYAFLSLTILHAFGPDLPTGMQGQHQVDEYIDIALSSNVPIVFSSIVLSEYVQFYFTNNNFSIYDQISIAEDVSVVREYLLSVYDTISVSEYLDEFNFDNLGISAFDLVSVSEYIEFLDEEIDLLVFDSISITDIAIMNDLIIELGIVIDNILISEYPILSPTPLYADGFDTITISDLTIVNILTLRISVNETIAISEYADILDLEIDLFVIDYASISDIIITDGLQGIGVGDDVGVNGALIDYIFVTDSAIVENAILQASVFDIIGLSEYVTVVDVGIELEISEDIYIAEYYSTYLDRFNINVSEIIGLLEIADLGMLISIQLSESIIVIESKYLRDSDTPIIPKKIFIVKPRKRYFLVESAR